MAIATESGNGWAGASSGGSATSVAKTFASTVGAGSLMVAVTQILTPGETVTFSDGVNTWTSVTPTASNGAVYGTLAFGFAINGSAGSRTVTASSTTSCNRAIATCSYTGASALPLDGTPTSAVGPGSSAVVAPGSITTTGAGLLLAAGVATGAGPLTAASGYTGTNFSLSGVYATFGVQEKITTGAVTENPGFGYSDSFWLSVGIAFKSASAGSVAPIIAYYTTRRD